MIRETRPKASLESIQNVPKSALRSLSILHSYQVKRDWGRDEEQVNGSHCDALLKQTLVRAKPPSLMREISYYLLYLLLSQVRNPPLLMLESQAGVLSCEIVSFLHLPHPPRPTPLSVVLANFLGFKNAVTPVVRFSYYAPQVNNKPPTSAPPCKTITIHCK